MASRRFGTLGQRSMRLRRPPVQVMLAEKCGVGHRPRRGLRMERCCSKPTAGVQRFVSGEASLRLIRG